MIQNNRFTLLESASRTQNYVYLTKYQGATHEEANALILATWGKPLARIPKVQDLRATEVLRWSKLANPKELSKNHGIPQYRFLRVGNEQVKFKLLETSCGLWVSRLEVCRALGLRDSFLSRLGPTVAHTHELEDRGYTGAFRKVEDVINGGQAARCISLQDAEIAFAVLSHRKGAINAA